MKSFLYDNAVVKALFWDWKASDGMRSTRLKLKTKNDERREKENEILKYIFK